MGAFLSASLHGAQAAVGSGDGGRSAAPDEAVDLFYRSKGLEPLYTRIQLSLSASKLVNYNVGVSTKSPLAIVYAKKISRCIEVLEEIGRTEVIMHNSNPVWIQKINLAFHFEVLDEPNYYCVGEANCVLSEIMTLPSRSMTLQLHGKFKYNVAGSITVHAEETIASKMAITMRLRCSNLDNKTEVVDNNLDPVWKPLCITTQQYVSKDNPLVIECFNFKRNGNHTFIGKLHTSIQDMEKLYKANESANFVFPSSYPKGYEKVLKGELFVDGYEEKKLYSVLDYISSGFELKFMVAVDFTASNGDPQNTKSLHYVGYSNYLNEYKEAIKEVGEVIQVYDHDKRFHAWGFGGKINDDPVSHCFNLSGNDGSSEVEGVQGIMDAYKNVLRTVILQGPTLFGQVINKAAEIAARSLSTNPTKYFVLLIITDGVLTDLQETKDAIVRASDLPLSILIVGVGGADFKQMKILDAHNGPPLESSTGRRATRDIVQFVPMRDVQYGNNSSIDGGKPMVQALLDKLPDQFLTYMRSKDIKPLGIDAHKAPLSADPLIT